MKRHAVLIWITLLYFWLLIFAQISKAETFQWSFNRYHFNQITGFRLYMGTAETALTTLVADIKKANVAVKSELPILVEEHFDAAPGTKYATSGAGSWEWVASTKNMKISPNGGDFMVIFNAAAGVVNDFNFYFWPEKSDGEKAAVYSYLKDESIPGYYELRAGATNGTAESNLRKVYDGKYGGIDGKFDIPRYAQCAMKSEGETICPGFRVLMSWAPGHYEATVNGVSVFGTDEKPMGINKLELIFNQQAGWIDDIIIGGKMTLQATAAVTLPAPKVWFAIAAYGPNGEGPKSIPTEYMPTSDTDSTDDTKLPAKPGKIIILK